MAIKKTTKKTTKKTPVKKVQVTQVVTKNKSRARVRSGIMAFFLTIMSLFGLSKYYGGVKPMLQFAADVISELIVKAPELSGNVVKVSDGDTLTMINSEGAEVKVRLYGIDAPETSQKYGIESQQALANAIIGKDVVLKVIDIDNYGRNVGIIEVNNIVINRKLLEDGYAWYYTAYCSKSFCREWEKIQNEAKQGKKGLWMQKTPQAPWEYRKQFK